MKKRSVLSLITLLSVALTFAQQEASNWAFGSQAGLTFDLGAGTVTPTQTAITTNEGCSSISDENGNLLFYTDGRTVWNRNNEVMSNGDYNGGTGLLGDPSSTSSGVIVPHPTNSNLYYIFTVDEPHHNNAWAFPNQGPADQNGNPLDVYHETFGDFQTVPDNDDGFNNGFNYSLVDMTLNGGFGDVVDTEKNVHLVTYDTSDPSQELYKCAEKITAVQGSDCQSVWVITHFVDSFYAFKVTENGVDVSPEVSEFNQIDYPNVPTISTQGYRRNGIGYIKSSPDGTKIAVCHAQNSQLPSDDNSQPETGSFWLYDFDNTTGTVSNPVNLISNVQTYGTEFSSDSKKLYVTNGTVVRQFDLDNNNAETIVYQGEQFISAMQLGPNNKIYVCNLESNTTLDVIENPEEAGTLCNYTSAAQPLALGTSAALGLPPFITSFFTERINIINDNPDVILTELALCDDQTYTLTANDIPGATYTWTLDGNPLSETDFDLEISTPGFYTVLIDNIPNDCNREIFGEADIGFFEIPVVSNQPEDIVVCDSSETSTFDLSVQDTDILGSQDPNQYTVHYYTSQDDADNNTNEIIGEFQNTETPQIIYARVDNNDNPNCFATTSFNISVFITPSILTLDDITVCDNDFNGNNMDGFTTTNLLDLNAGILGPQDETLYTISYHPTQQDADDNTNGFPDSYVNTTPNLEEIFVRIENNANTDCYATDSFILTVNNSPDAIDATLIQCDEDGIPEGFTIFDLNQAFDDITGGAPDRTINFYVSLADLENNEDELNPDAFENYFNPQTIYALVTDTSTGCINIAELTLETSSTSSNNAILEVCDDDGTEDGFYNFNLSNALDDILFGLPADLEVTFYETYEEALIEDNPLGNSFTNTTPNSQMIYARVENMNACFGISEIQLTVFELPNIVIQEEVFYCLNSFPETITLTGGLIDDTPNNYYYDWSTGEDEFEIEVNAPGTYTVRVTSTDGCFKDRTIIVSPSDIATITNIEVTDATNNNSISVFVSGDGIYEYALDDINGPYQESNIFENVSFGFHTVYVRDIKNNCGIAEEIVSVIGFPKFFTPNGDTYNQHWQVKGISADFQPNSQILIFDRFGKLLKELDPLGPGWDGTFNGFNMPASDYWFVTTLEDGRVFKGHFALKR